MGSRSLGQRPPQRLAPLIAPPVASSAGPRAGSRQPAICGVMPGGIAAPPPGAPMTP
ncbi:hypothetical protein DM47_2530 [Burkholderia mallei]|nr:hypothetical protein DM47_2530 [Burkholderia mallei]